MTVSIILIFIFAFLLVDLALYVYRGNDATVSRTFLAKAASTPSLAVITAYTFGLLLGHFFLISTDQEFSWGVALSRLALAISPTIVGLVILSRAKFSAPEKILRRLSNPFLTAIWVSMGIAAGMTVGYYLIPQHVTVEAPTVQEAPEVNQGPPQ